MSYKRNITVQYRSADGSSLFAEDFDFMDDTIPEHKIMDGTKYILVPRASKSGVSMLQYVSQCGTHTIEEFWHVNAAPDQFTRDGITYVKQYGVPTLVESTRLGTGLIQKTSKSFQDILKNAHKKTPGSKLGDKL